MFQLLLLHLGCTVYGQWKQRGRHRGHPRRCRWGEGATKAEPARSGLHRDELPAARIHLPRGGIGHPGGGGGRPVRANCPCAGRNQRTATGALLPVGGARETMDHDGVR
uniref:Putative secreted protein n=1 Tax=Anopheles triannulatus TaxID=58253 RepID=A0A2M4B3P7_9DIPT